MRDCDFNWKLMDLETVMQQYEKALKSDVLYESQHPIEELPSDLNMSENPDVQNIFLEHWPKMKIIFNDLESQFQKISCEKIGRLEVPE